MLSRVQKSVREWTLTLPRSSHFGSWSPDGLKRQLPSEGNYRGQNIMDWKDLYIIGKLLKRRCLKWVHMNHLDTWVTNYGQKKGWQSQLWEFWNSHLGILGKNVICMWVSWKGTKYTIRGKVMASPKFGPWWILCVQGCPWFVLRPKVLQLCTNQLVVWFVQICESDWLLVIIPSPIPKL
jgi:hypothetical protein